ncbi:MAG TPA: hypothetical protein VFN31_01790, partial [Candidatus Saccharimonadales bacterium]|nr:hypothetical protein [Candidatus Saccharimonadales bacterium]
MAGPLVAIVGETGSGKSELAIKIAKDYGGEIVCADAWTIRKGMDIGTAKPSIDDQKAVPHHLLDLVSPDQSFSVAQFQKQANVVIRSIHKRHKIPILVGGSGLYVDSVLYDYSFLTTDSKYSRDELNNKELVELKLIADQEQINTDGVDGSNKRRLVRLIETKGEIPKKKPLRNGSVILG